MLQSQGRCFNSGPPFNHHYQQLPLPSGLTSSNLSLKRKYSQHTKSYIFSSLLCTRHSLLTCVLSPLHFSFQTPLKLLYDIGIEIGIVYHTKCIPFSTLNLLCSAPLCSVLFYSILFYSILTQYILFHYIIFYSILSFSVQSYSIIFYSI